MTVAQLIEILSKYDDDMKVAIELIYIPTGESVEITDVKTEDNMIILEAN